MIRIKRLGIHLPMLILLTVVTVTLRTVALFINFNSSSGFFENKLIISISDGIMFAAVLILISFVFISPKINAVASFKSALTFIPSGLVSCALLFLSFDLIASVAKKPDNLISKDILFDPASLLAISAAVLGAVCVINFFTTVLYSQKENERRALFGILTVIFLTVYAMYLYFDIKLPINSPNKIVDQMAFLFSAVFFLYETRISLGREMWRCYCAFAFVASIFTAYSSVPTLIYYLVSGEMVSDSLAEAVLLFTLFIYITARLIMVIFLFENEKSKAALAVEKLAYERSSELALPDQARNINKDENFNTRGMNYQFDIHISDVKNNGEIGAEEPKQDQKS